MFRGEVCIKTDKYHVNYILHQKEITDRSKRCSTRLGKSKMRYSVMLRKRKVSVYISYNLTHAFKIELV